jgi:hypothetical protein
MTQARISGPAEELGQFETLTFYGHALSGEWTRIDPTPDVLEKLKGNRFVEIRDGSGRQKPSEVAPIDTVPEIKARLDELGVAYDARAKKAELEELLADAEAAHAAAAAEKPAEEA